MVGVKSGSDPIEIRPIGYVSSSLESRGDAPLQADEGAPGAWLELDPAMRSALDGLRVGDVIVVVTWLHLADRTVLTTHPRNDRTSPSTGVFATRSPDRPNPIGLHEARATAIDGSRVRLTAIEAVNGTPVLDIKPALAPVDER